MDEHRLGTVLLAVALFSAASPAPRAQQTPLFPAAQYRVGAYPLGVAAADMDADGKVDLVSADSGANTLSVLRGNGSGGFASAIPVPVALEPRAVEVGDLNGDGKPDLAAACGAANAVTVVIGDGTGAFGLPAIVSVGQVPHDVAIGDIDLNGRPDLVSADYLGNTVSVAIAKPAHGFEATISIAAGGLNPQDVDLADFDGDGALDLALGADPAVVRLGDGLGGFSAPTHVFASWGTTHCVAPADFDLDGDLDLVATFWAGSPNRAAVSLGDGAGGFAAVAAVSLSAYVATAIAAGDVDADGWTDAVAASENGGTAIVLRGDGTGALAVASVHAIGTMEAGASDAIDLVDVDADGDLDIATACGQTREVTVLLGQGTGAFLVPDVFPLESASGGAVGDLDGDGHPDLAIVANGGSVGRIGVALGDGAGGFLPPTYTTVETFPRVLAIADMNVDGIPDVTAVFENSTGPARLAVLPGDGAGGFGPASYLPIGFVHGFTDLVAADFNLNGKPDVALASPSTTTGTVQVFLGTGTGGFSIAPAISIPFAYPLSLDVGSLDADGRPDLVVGALDGSKLLTLMGDGAGAFSVGVHCASCPSLGAIAAHLDADGKQDVVAGSAGAPSSTVVVHPGDGQGGFGPYSTIEGGISPRRLAAGDVDGDGRTDVVASNLFGANHTLFVGDGAGGFSGAADFASGTQPTLLGIVDVDADGRADIVSLRSQSAVVLRNQAGVPAGVAAYGLGTTGCAGAHGLVANAMPKVGASGFGLIGTNGPPSATGFLVLGVAQSLAGIDPLGIGLALHVDPLSGPIALFSLSSDEGGSSFAPLPLPSDPSAVGITAYVQELWPWAPIASCDPSALLLSSSKGLAITLQP